MKTRYNFIDPAAVMGIIVALIILGVGVFAAFVTITQITTSQPYTAPSATTSLLNNESYTRTMWAINNTSSSAVSVFNIVGIVLVIGAIMSIIGLVWSYVRQ